MIITYFNYVWDIEGISAGAATKAEELVRAINNLGHTAYLEWRTLQPEGRATVSVKMKERLKPKIQRYLHEPKRVARNFPNLVKEYRIFSRQKPDIFFNRLELYTFSGTWLSRWLNIPMVVEADCPPTYEHMNFYGKDHKHLGGLSTKIEIQTLQEAEAIIAISNVLKTYYVDQGVHSEKIHVIPNGVDPEKFRPRQRPPRLVKKYALEGKVVIGWIGSLVGWTGIEKLVPLALHILDMYPSVVFMLVGGGANREFFRKELLGSNISYSSRVILPGAVPHEEVPDYLACMDIVLAPYPKLPFWYASSMKVFEYMATGKAVIASDVGQVREVIRNGKNGLLFDPNDPHDLRRKAIMLLENLELRQSLGEQARRDVLDKYTWDGHARRIVTVFEDVLRRRSKSLSHG